MNCQICGEAGPLVAFLDYRLHHQCLIDVLQRLRKADDRAIWDSVEAAEQHMREQGLKIGTIASL